MQQLVVLILISHTIRFIYTAAILWKAFNTRGVENVHYDFFWLITIFTSIRNDKTPVNIIQQLALEAVGCVFTSALEQKKKKFYLTQKKNLRILAKNG